MSIHDQPPVQKTNVPVESMPPYPHTKEDTVVPAPEHRDDKHKKRFGKRTIASLVGGAVALGAGAFGYNSLNSDDKEPVKNTDAAPELVLGPDGEPLQYVEYSTEHEDRDNSGSPDNLTDSNENGVMDHEELWDQENKEFVTPEEAGLLDEILANATEEDLANIAEIERTIPDFSSIQGVNWKADFIALDPVVKDRVMFALRHPEEYPGDELLSPEEAWQASVSYQFTRTPEDILD